jgi:protein-tyrosine phosphatase
VAPSDEPYRICFVCLGNICRSPTAEAVMQRLVEDAGLADRIELDSAGTGGWHVGEPPDERAAAEATRRGIPMTSRGRQFHPGDLEWFDLVVAMDSMNLADLRAMAAPHHHDKVVLLRTFDRGADHHDVPDPYYGGVDGFRDVFDLIDAACRGLLDHVRGQLDGER